MSAPPKHPKSPDARGAHSLHRLVGPFLSLFLLYGIQSALAISAVLSQPESHLISSQTGCRNKLHKFNSIDNTRLERWSSDLLTCRVGFLLCYLNAVIMPSESHLQAKLANVAPIIFAEIEPLAEQDKPSSDEGTDKGGNCWIEFYHNFSWLIGLPFGGLTTIVIYQIWPNLWPNSIIGTLCGDRDYVEVKRKETAKWAFSRAPTPHNYSLSRKAKSESLGLKAAALPFGWCNRLRVCLFISRSASMY